MANIVTIYRNFSKLFFCIAPFKNSISRSSLEEHVLSCVAKFPKYKHLGPSYEKLDISTLF